MALRHLFASASAVALSAIPAAAAAQPAIWNMATPVVVAGVQYPGGARTSSYEARRAAYENGYREGSREGERDGRRGERFAFEDEREFRRADRGYHRSFGDRERYRQIFRDGYESGYTEAFSRFSRYGRMDRRPGPYPGRGPYGQQGGYGGWGYGYPEGRYRSPAVEHGLREGYEKGQEDARKRRSFDPRRHAWYRAGDRHYDRDYGPRDSYKDAYRRAFQDGYEHGYGEGEYRRW